MAYRSIWSDGFGGYASQAAAENAYPYNPPGDMSTSFSGGAASPYLHWGLTNGPGGGPGLYNNSGAGAPDPFGNGPFAAGLSKVSLTTACRGFKVEADFDFTGYVPTQPANASSVVLDIWAHHPGDQDADFYGSLVVLQRAHSSGNLLITVMTSPAFANGGLVGGYKGTYQTTVAAGLTVGGTRTVTIQGMRSVLTETSPGSGLYAPSTDGSVEVLVNGTSIFTFSGAVWHGRRTVEGTVVGWNAVRAKVTPRFSNFTIYDSTECAAAIVDSTDPCCATGGGGTVVPTGGGTGGGATPIAYPEIGHQLECAGGGDVPTQADLVFSETWWTA